MQVMIVEARCEHREEEAILGGRRLKVEISNLEAIQK